MPNSESLSKNSGSNEGRCAAEEKERDMQFEVHDILLNTDGLKPNATHEQIQGATDVMRTMLERSKNSSFELRMLPHESELIIEWQCGAGGAGVLVWREKETYPAFSIVCAGLDPAADEAMLNNFLDWINASTNEKLVKELKSYKPPFISTIYNLPSSISRLHVCPEAIGFGQAYFTRLDETAPPQRGNLGPLQ
jgi:hypothetical protein